MIGWIRIMFLGDVGRVVEVVLNSEVLIGRRWFLLDVVFFGNRIMILFLVSCVLILLI